jgi:RNA polymerase sigma factor (sigma-70 family)
VQKEDDRKDMLQDVFETASKKIKNGQYDFSIVFGAWITGIAQNKVRQHFDKRNPRKKLRYGFEEENDNRSSEQPLHMDDHWLKEVLLVLTAHEREVFELRFVLGLKYKAIGDKLSINAATARHIYDFSLEKMRIYLEEHGIHKGDL